jgi:hypothetical protein
MSGKHLLAMHEIVAVIQNRAEEEKQGQGNPHGSRSGSKPSLNSCQQNRKQRNRGEDGKMYDPKKVKIGWHDAPRFSFESCMGAGGIVKPLRQLRLEVPPSTVEHTARAISKRELDVRLNSRRLERPSRSGARLRGQNGFYRRGNPSVFLPLRP